jgi:pentatricopeptide repeat protein
MATSPLNQKKHFKIKLFILIATCCALLWSAKDAWCFNFTFEEQELINAVNYGLSVKSSRYDSSKLMDRLKQVRLLREIYGLITFAQAKKGAINIYIVNFLIKKLSYEVSRELFEIAKKKYLANVITYNSFITAAGNAGKFLEAEAAFNDAKAKKIADAFTYSSFITAARNAGRFAEAAFDDARANNLADVVTYYNFIDVLVVQADLTHDVLQKAEYFNKAKDIFLGTLRIKDDCNFADKKLLDFHTYSYGAAYIACNMSIEKLPVGNSITLIVGKGLHSESEYQVVKMGVISSIYDYNKENVSVITYQDKSKESGRIEITKRL